MVLAAAGLRHVLFRVFLPVALGALVKEVLLLPDSGEYEVSGNNVDGVIVTRKVG